MGWEDFKIEAEPVKRLDRSLADVKAAEEDFTSTNYHAFPTDDDGTWVTTEIVGNSVRLMCHNLYLKPTEARRLAAVLLAAADKIESNQVG